MNELIINLPLQTIENIPLNLLVANSTYKKKIFDFNYRFCKFLENQIDANNQLRFPSPTSNDIISRKLEYNLFEQQFVSAIEKNIVYDKDISEIIESSLSGTNNYDKFIIIKTNNDNETQFLDWITNNSSKSVQVISDNELPLDVDLNFSSLNWNYYPFKKIFIHKKFNAYLNKIVHSNEVDIIEFEDYDDAVEVPNKIVGANCSWRTDKIDKKIYYINITVTTSDIDLYFSELTNFLKSTIMFKIQLNLTFIINKIIDKNKMVQFFLLLKKIKVKFIGKIIFTNNYKTLRINSVNIKDINDISQIIKKAWQLHLVPLHYKEYTMLG